jgi:hypothetical protein
VTHWIHPKHPPSKDHATTQFEVEWAIDKVQKMSFDEAADYTANLIHSKYPELYLCLSGGMDSIFVGDVLLRNKIPFVPVIIDYFGVDPDIWYAYYWCEQHDITPLIHKITAENNDTFIRHLLKHAVQNKTDVNIGYITNVAADIIPKTGSLITGCGEPLHVPFAYDDISPEYIEIHECCYYVQMSYGMDQHPGGLFNYAPEMLFNMVREADLNKNTQEIKSKLYRAPFRPKINNVNDICHWGQWEGLKNKMLKDHDLKSQKIKKVDFLALVS